MSMQRLQEENAYDDGGLGAFDWSGLITQGFDFGKTFLNAKYAKDAAKYQTPPTPVLTNTTTPPAGDPNALQGGVSGSGFYIGQTFVPWSYVIVGGGLFALVQMTGFTRKGR